MQIDITRLLPNAWMYSASAAELGVQAGQITWANATAAPMLIDTDEKRDAVREHVKGYGAWDCDEIAGWSDAEVNAIFVQFASGDYRQALEPVTDAEWKRYEKLAESGCAPSSLYRDTGGIVWFTLES